jgi:hypothetical protein
MEIVQDVVHQSLKCLRGVGQSERHDKEFELTMMSAKGGLGDIDVVDPDLMIATVQVELGEEPHVTQLVQQLVDDRDRVHVMHHLGVEGVVIDAKAPRAVVLFHQED